MKPIIRKIVNWWNGCSEEDALKAKAEYEAAAKRLPDKPTPPPAKPNDSKN